ncbi:hypothetical protein JCM3774_006435, partial [Rhodotorula dairenensis]
HVGLTEVWYQHDQKRRESEVQSLHQRLQKLTTAPASSSGTESAFTRFTILNGAMSSPAASSPVTATFTATQTGRSSRVASRVPVNVGVTAAPTSAVEAELELVRSTLDERISTCSHLERENLELRTFVGDVGEWADGVLEIDELATVRKDREEGGEMRGVLNHDGDESYLVPAPHLALPVAALTSPLHRKLYAIRLGLSSLSEQSAATLALVRDELEGEIERLNEEVEEEVLRREGVEKEREVALEAVRQGEMLVEEWAHKAQVERRRRLTGSPASDDDIPAPEDTVDERRRVRAASAHDPPTARAARPSAPSAHVADFLADLGLDTPSAAEKEKAPSKSAAAKPDATSVSSRGDERPRSRGAGARDERRTESRRQRGPTAQIPKEQEGDMLPPPAPRAKSSSSSSSSSARGPVSASTSLASTTSGSSTEDSEGPARRERERAAPPANHEADLAAGPSSTLQGILALADSPPVSSEPLISTAAASARATTSSSRSLMEPRAVLAPSTRRVNAAAAEDQLTEDIGDRVAAKKQALLARARSVSARKVPAA